MSEIVLLAGTNSGAAVFASAALGSRRGEADVWTYRPSICVGCDDFHTDLVLDERLELAACFLGQVCRDVSSAFDPDLHVVHRAVTGQHTLEWDSAGSAG